MQCIGTFKQVFGAVKEEVGASDVEEMLDSISNGFYPTTNSGIYGYHWGALYRSTGAPVLFDLLGYVLAKCPRDLSMLEKAFTKTQSTVDDDTDGKNVYFRVQRHLCEIIRSFDGLLHGAAKCNRLFACRAIVDRLGLELTEKDDHGKTALSYAEDTFLIYFLTPSPVRKSAERNELNGYRPILGMIVTVFLGYLVS